MDALDFSQMAQLLGLFLPMGREALAWLGAVPWGVRILLLLWLLWVFYLAVMNLQRVHKAGNLGRVALVLGIPVLVVGFVLDVLANLVIFTVLLLEWPRRGEWTVTARLKRHHGATTWRARVAQWFETELLGSFDPKGTHIN
ncbi:hypothetical protein [Hydrogenophaga sp.]|uniref:hypothetical protein n=1 Tax=Hydrogenophaga sp. TaxID=1904254 RepID=UPI003D1221FA